jgi:hypothetical protein
MAEPEITENFLKALDRYLSGEILMDDAVDEASLKTRKQFQERIRIAHSRNMLSVRAYIDPDLCTKMREWIGPTRGIEAYVVKGRPDNKTFYLSVAEKFLIFIRKLLLDENLNEINIGIISGSSTASMVEHLVDGRLWQEVMASPIEEREETKPIDKIINVIALNATIFEGWELGGSANLSTLRLSKMLKDKLPNCHVTPYGISTGLVIREADKEDVDKSASNIKKIEIVDPRRLDPKKPSKSKLNLLITGVGAPADSLEANSIFQKVIESEGITAPQNMVGDVAFCPVDRDGKELKLTKDGEKYKVYSAIDLSTMQQLASGGGVVMLIARNSRRNEKVDKTKAIRAAIRGRYINVISTDEKTANSIIEEPI